MHKHFLMGALLLAPLLGFSQDNKTDTSPDKSNAKHEFRLDAVEAIAVPALDISYEYILSQYSGVGATVWIGLDSDINDYQSFAITPYYRQYFFNKKDYGARGFYAEGLLQFAMGEDNDEDWSKFGIGFALGQKWVSKNGFSLDLSLGLGRYLGSSDIGPEIFFRGGVGVGYRF